MDSFSMTVINELRKIKCLELVRHNNDSGYINVRCTTSKHPKRFNVIGDFNTNTGYMKLFSNHKWRSNRELGLNDVDAIIELVKKDIGLLERGISHPKNT